MNFAGSVGFQVPPKCCHCRFTPAISWKRCDMFLATVTSSARYSSVLHELFCCWKMMPRLGSTAPKPPNGWFGPDG